MSSTQTQLPHVLELLSVERRRLLNDVDHHRREIDICAARVAAIDQAIAALAPIDQTQTPPPPSPSPAPGPGVDPELDRLLDEEEQIARRHTAPGTPAGDPTADPGLPARHEWGTVPDYVEVARVVNRARREGRPIKRAVCDHFHVRATTAANWLTKCRKLGLLEPDAPPTPQAPCPPPPVTLVVDGVSFVDLDAVLAEAAAEMAVAVDDMVTITVDATPVDRPWTSEPITRGEFDADAARDEAAVSMFGAPAPMSSTATAPSRPAAARPVERDLDPVRVWTPEDAAALIDGSEQP